jgi:ubiquinol-cytochrome c reductase cytochrome b subunit
MRYKGWYSRIALLLFVVSFVILGVLGTKIATGPRTALAQICTVYYFAFFRHALVHPQGKDHTAACPCNRSLHQHPAVAAQSGPCCGLITVLPLKAVGAEAGVELEPFHVNLDDKASCSRGRNVRQLLHGLPWCPVLALQPRSE